MCKILFLGKDTDGNEKIFEIEMSIKEGHPVLVNMIGKNVTCAMFINGKRARCSSRI